jgi:WhiB family redox-sensing transcriptional regulator
VSNVAGNLARAVPKFPTAPLMGDWVDRAACAGLDPQLFHPEWGEVPDAAKAISQSCPVRADCLDWALRTNQQYGIWGGLSVGARRRLRHTNPEPTLGARAGRCCGARYRPGRRNQRFCSADCRNHHRNAWSRR